MPAIKLLPMLRGKREAGRTLPGFRREVQRRGEEPFFPSMCTELAVIPAEP